MKLMDFLEKYLTPIGASLGNNRYLKAVSSGLVAIVSATIVGSVFTLLANLPIGAYTEWLSSTGLNTILSIPGQCTTDLIALYAVFFISYHLAKSFDKDGAGAGLAALVSFMIVTGRTAFLNAEGGTVNAIATDFLGAKGLFSAMIIALIGTRIYVWIIDKGWVIKLPDSVPPAVSNSFSALIPSGIVITLWVIVSGLMRLTSFGTLHSMIFNVIQSNLMRFMGNNIWSYMFFSFATNILWFFGLHGGNIVNAITNPVYIPLSLENLAAFQAGETVMPNIISSSFVKTFTSGGVGSMLGLAIVMCLFAKSKQMKTLGRLALPTTIFFINEPLLFGIPIVLNPLFFFPLLFLTPTLSFITYNLMRIGLVPIPHGIQLPWTMPPIFNGFLQGGIGLAIYEAITIVIAAAVWYPFFRIVDKQALAQEQAENSENEE